MVINALLKHDYSGGMPARKVSSQRRKPAVSVAAKAPKERTNRIRELAKRDKLTYGEIAARIGTSETQIARLANGERKLNQDWMNRLAGVFSVTPSEIIDRTAPSGLRVVKVTGSVQAGRWAESHGIPEDEQDSVMVPDDPAQRGLHLYAVQIRGESMNQLYPDGSVAVLNSIMQRPGEILAGKRYHVRVTRADGSVEDTVKTLVRDSKGQYWLKPESDSPEFTATLLEPHEGEQVELIGRVRWCVRRED